MSTTKTTDLGTECGHFLVRSVQALSVLRFSELCSVSHKHSQPDEINTDWLIEVVHAVDGSFFNRAVYSNGNAHLCASCIRALCVLILALREFEAFSETGAHMVRVDDHMREV